MRRKGLRFGFGVRAKSEEDGRGYTPYAWAIAGRAAIGRASQRYQCLGNTMLMARRRYDAAIQLLVARGADIGKLPAVDDSFDQSLWLRMCWHQRFTE